MKVSALFLAAIGTIGTALAAIMPPGTERLIIMILFTGLPVMALTSRRWTPLGFVLAVLSLALPMWSALSLAMWAFQQNTLLPWAPFLLGLPCLLLAGLRKSKIQFAPSHSADTMALILTVLVAIPVVVIQQVNGVQPSEDGPRFESRSFIANDSHYLFALAQRSLDTQQYPRENPFMAGAPNRYPSFLHCGLGGLSSLSDDVVAIASWPVYPWLILPGIGLCFLAIQRLLHQRNIKTVAWLALGYLAVIVIRLDHVLIPQTHALSFPLLALVLYHYPGTPRVVRWRQLLPFSMLALAMMASHAVSAAVPLTIFSGMTLRALFRRYPFPGIAAYLLVGVVVLLGFALANFHVSHEVIAGVVLNTRKWQAFQSALLPYLPAVALIIVTGGRLSKTFHPWQIAAYLLAVAGVCYWIQGITASSDVRLFFATFNSCRFILYGLMLALPLLFRAFPRYPGYCGGALFCYALAMLPNQVKHVVEFTGSSPNAVTISQIRDLRRLLGPADRPVTYISSIPMFGPAAFSGKSQFNPQNRYFALGTVPEKWFFNRTRQTDAFFQKMTPAERAAFMSENSIDAAITYNQPALLLDEDLATVRRGQIWTLYLRK